jgi:hypothetical protein
MTDTDETGRLRRVLFVVALLALLYVVGNIAAFAAIYWGDDYAVPSWNENSVPPPKTY